MGREKEAVISGFNKYIKSFKDKKVLFSLTTFDSHGLDKVYVCTPIGKVKKLNEDTFVPRGSTPLYDACVDIIEAAAKKTQDNEPSLVVIMTDGLENASTKHDQSCLNDLVKKLKEKDNWTFVFMGANQDSWATASGFGFSSGSVQDFRFNSRGISKGFDQLSQANTSYVAMVSTGNTKSTEDFFNKGSK